MDNRKINVIQHKRATSTSLKYVPGVREGAAIKAYPTSAGTATVYSSNSPIKDCETDIASGDFTTGVASWDAWGAGAVSAKTSQVATMPLSCVAIVPASGTWTLEVSK